MTTSALKQDNAVRTRKPQTQRKVRGQGAQAPTLQPQSDSGETKSDKFHRLGRARVQRTLTSIRLIGNLASPNYEWTDKDVAAIRLSVTSALDQVLKKFEKGQKLRTEFQFDSRAA